MRILCSLLILLSLRGAFGFEKIVCFPGRINSDAQIETKLRAAIAAGADGVIFDQWSKQIPFTSWPREADLIAEQHRLLSICDSAGISAWLVSQVSSKCDYGDPVAIPLKVMSDSAVHAEFEPTDVTLSEQDPRAYVRVRAEFSRLYTVSLSVAGDPVQMIWMRDPDKVENQAANVVRVTVQPGSSRIECPALDDTEHWLLLFRNEKGGSNIHVDSITETAPLSKSVRRKDGTQAREGWYDYLGVPSQGFTWSRSARFENDSLRRLIIDKHCSFLAREFGRHKSVAATLNWSDEWGNGGHDWSFQQVFPSAGAGFAAELARWADIQARYFTRSGLAFGDMFYREGKYSRACSARGGGFEDALDYLPATTPIELIVWDETADSSILSTQVQKLKGRPWVIGVYMEGKEQSRTWRQVYDQYSFSPRPTKVIFFGWNDEHFTEEHLRGEFEAWSDE